MFNQILKTTQNGYYQEKNDLIQNTIDRYNNARGTVEDEKKLAVIRADCENVLSGLVAESGFTDTDNAYVSIEQEFYPEGYLDPTRVKKFQMNTLLHMGEQQVKWTFAGTTSNYSPITQKTITDTGKDYAELLPKPIKDRYAKQKSMKATAANDTDFRLYLYPDGSSSGEFDPLKAKLATSDLGDKSGFDWTKGYSPNNTVERKNWTAGFNEEGQWEMFETGKERETAPMAAENITIGELDDLVAVSKNTISFISVPDDKSFILFDPALLLMTGYEENFYSLDGEIYGTRSVDVERSVASTREYLKRNKVTKLTGIVVPDRKKETIEYYKRSFPGLVTEKTSFYTPKSKQLKKEISAIQEKTATTAISENIISGFLSLSRQGRKGDDLFEGLVPSLVRPEYEVNLNIFKTGEDMNNFINLPVISEVLEEDTRNYLQNVSVPEQKKAAFSNVVQNVLHNYNTIFKHAHLEQKDLLEKSFDAVVNNDPQALKEITVVREKRLVDVINANKKTAQERTVKKEITRLDIPSFKQQFREEDDYTDITSQKGFEHWKNTELKKIAIPKESIEKVQNTINETPVPEEKKKILSRVMYDTFGEFNSIKTSTGMSAAELATVIIENVINGHIENRYLNKKVYYEKGLEALIEESSQKNMNKFKIVKDDIFIKKSVPGRDAEINLLTEQDLTTFQLSPFMLQHGFSEKEQEEIITTLKKVTVNSGQSREFSHQVISVLRDFDKSLRPVNITPAQTVTAVQQIIEGRENKVRPEILASVKKIISRPGITHDHKAADGTGGKSIKDDPKNAETTGQGTDSKPVMESKQPDKKITLPAEKTASVPLNLFKKKEYRQFVELPLFKQSGITQQQLDTIIELQRETLLHDNIIQVPVPAATASINNTQKETPRTGPFGTHRFDSKFVHTVPVHFLSRHDEVKKTTREHVAAKNIPAHKTDQDTSDMILMGPDKNILYNAEDKASVFNTVYKQKQNKTVKNVTITDFGRNTLQKNRTPVLDLFTQPAFYNETEPQPETRFYTVSPLNNMVYTAPFISPAKRSTSYQLNRVQQPGQPRIKSSMPASQQVPNAATITSAMDRINANYIADKQALARTDSGENKEVSSAKKPGGPGNKIKKGIDELFDEFINKIEYDM